MKKFLIRQFSYQAQCIFLAFLLLILFSCQKKTEVKSEGSNSQNTMITGELDYEKSSLIGSKILSSVQNLLADYKKSNNTSFNLQNLLSQIKKMSNVKDAILTNNQDAIVIEQSDGAKISFILFPMDDRTNFKLLANNASNITGKLSQHELANNASGNYTYVGNKNVIILAPFQKAFDQKIVTMKHLLEDAGYHVDYYPDTAATIDRFSSDNLKKYGFIFINTHGHTAGYDTPSNLTTGQLYDWKFHKNLSDDIKHYVGKLTVQNDSREFFGLLPKYFEKTLHGRFPNSMVFLNACGSLSDDAFSSFFLKNGASAVCGYEDEIQVDLANAIEMEMLYWFVNKGENFDNTYKNVLSDQGLKQNFLLTFLLKKINVNQFVYVSANNDRIYSEPNFVGSANAGFTPRYGSDNNQFTLNATFFNAVNYIDHVKFKMNEDDLKEYTMNFNSSLQSPFSDPKSKQFWLYQGFINIPKKVIPFVNVFFLKSYDINNKQIETATGIYPTNGLYGF